MSACPKCGAPARHMPPDGDFRYDPPIASTPAPRPPSDPPPLRSGEASGEAAELRGLADMLETAWPNREFDPVIEALCQAAARLDAREEEVERLISERDAAVKDYGDNLVELSETHRRAEAAEQRAERAETVLRKTAGCASHAPGDVVDMARAALAASPRQHEIAAGLCVVPAEASQLAPNDWVSVPRQLTQRMIEATIFDGWREPIGYEMRRRIWTALLDAAPVPAEAAPEVAALVTELRTTTNCDPECEGRCRRCPDEVDRAAADMLERQSIALQAADARAKGLEAAGNRIIEMLNKAGLLRLSEAVQLGPTVWYCHIMQAIEWWEAERVAPPPATQGRSKAEET